jgi:hypothetical protein
MRPREHVGDEGSRLSTPGCAVVPSDDAWQEEMPTRPVGAALARTAEPEGVAPSAPAADGPVIPRTLHKATAELNFDELRVEAPAEAPAPAAKPSTKPPIAIEADGPWFESMRPPASSLVEMTTDRGPEAARPRRWIGWTMLTLSVGACAGILVAASLGRARVAAHAASSPAASMAGDHAAAEAAPTATLPRALAEAPARPDGRATAPAAARAEVPARPEGTAIAPAAARADGARSASGAALQPGPSPAKRAVRAGAASKAKTAPAPLRSAPLGR